MRRMDFPLAFVFASALAVSGMSATAVVAEGWADDLVPIGPGMAIEKSVIKLSIPEDNALPWASVKGVVSNPVPDYPVIIQIYDDAGVVAGNADGAIHFAQVDVDDDGTYQHKFRVLDVVDGSEVRIFEGDYTVKIFKIVYTDGAGLSSA